MGGGIVEETTKGEGKRGTDSSAVQGGRTETEEAQ